MLLGQGGHLPHTIYTFYLYVHFMCTLCALYKTKPSVLELLCWGLFSVFLYMAVFWLTCRYRKQRSAARGMWSFLFSFFLSSSLVTISCKEDRTFQRRCDQRKAVAEGSGRLPATLSAYSVCCKACHSPRYKGWILSAFTAGKEAEGNHDANMREATIHKPWLLIFICI